MRLSLLLIAVAALWGPSASASVLTFGDQDCLGFGCYGASDPTSGATLSGLSSGVVTQSSNFFGHGFPFSPSADFAGTDQIYVGSVQSGAHDGYSAAAERINGPQILSLDYSSLVPAGQVVTSLTLGLATDDFQFPDFGQPFSALLNGNAASPLTATLNALSEGGPQVHFFTIGLDTSLDNLSHTLTVSIDQAGDGGDGWAVDFATVGVTTAPENTVPEPGTAGLLSIALAAVALARRWGTL